LLLKFVKTVKGKLAGDADSKIFFFLQKMHSNRELGPDKLFTC